MEYGPPAFLMRNLNGCAREKNRSPVFFAGNNQKPFAAPPREKQDRFFRRRAEPADPVCGMGGRFLFCPTPACSGERCLPGKNETARHETRIPSHTFFCGNAALRQSVPAKKEAVP